MSKIIINNNIVCHRSSPTSGYYGVSYLYDKRKRKAYDRPWRARYTRYVLVDGHKYGREINLGYFKTAKKAARAYNEDIIKNADVNVHAYKLNVTKG